MTNETQTSPDTQGDPEQPQEPTLKQRVAGITYRTLRWGRDKVPAGLRIPLGILMMIGGVFGFLPILGFWMLPLGAAFVALDIPPARKRIDTWMVQLKTTAKGSHSK